VVGTDAPVPEVPECYRTAQIKHVSDEDFAALLGRPIPNGNFGEELTILDTISRFVDAKNPLARWIGRSVGRSIEKSRAKGDPAPTMLYVYNLPIRGLAQMTQGYITRQMLEEVLGDISLDQTMMHADQDQAPRAPGMKYRHYAPAGELTVVEGDPEAVVAYINQAVAKDEAEGKKTGVIGTAEYLERYHADSVKCIGSRDEEASIAKNLYAILRAFDDEAVQKIYSESFSAEGLGQAIMNRLLKASGHRVVRLEEEPAEES
jgi:hypothetical protein